MARLVKCAFCGNEILPGTGLMYIKVDGSVMWFCSRKCYKNMLVLNRKATKLKWTKVAKR
ncbi:50S ribosomal protein L24e [Fervidicoccus fontis]|jgi:large subunit ribosomal protein L24e|uniref:Large ribosomal subunit protein eL24 n=2 Tax=Fervidicoccus fontis TaxID=683846 RepID=I0A0D2_FERFK|nr:50S ribosomal protein L24e [Fervidicoccus fontis]AFH42439.1 Ribosomal protein L24E [Fervidicoccus fontis Kam940]MBE9391053.1 50S ribosomal protein L24e [Fervidicoccus fontis]PMB76065.1 MAG: 50S ribosomal protein L24e [Fervidicoccus fontis]HEW63537.1 50S ribosomal protein L24e [Fervidicoccus fontis]